MATPPCASISLTSSLSRSARRAARMTLAPSLAKDLATAAPMPELAPVMIATRSCRRFMFTPLNALRALAFEEILDQLRHPGRIVMVQIVTRVRHLRIGQITDKRAPGCKATGLLLQP